MRKGIIVAVFSGLLLVVEIAAAQQPESAPERQLQLGIGLAPGIGMQFGYVVPIGFVTGEGVSYFNLSPSFGGGEGSLQFSAAMGGALRIMRILLATGSSDLTEYDFDFGFRFGPHFFIPYNTEPGVVSPTDTFSMFTEPYLRGTTVINGHRTLFLEFGLQAPLLRFGLMIDI